MSSQRHISWSVAPPIPSSAYSLGNVWPVEIPRLDRRTVVLSHDYGHEERMGRRFIPFIQPQHILKPLTRSLLVLSSNAFARRWRECNSLQLSTTADEDREMSWRRELLGLLTSVHSMGGIADSSFDVVPSLNSVSTPFFV